jgi:hypothetical protein
METAMTDAWQERAREAATRRRTIWIWSPIFLGVGLAAIAGGALGDGLMRPVGLVCGALMTLWGFLYGTAVYMRTVDEQERDANLWGCYVGMCAYLLLFLLNEVLALVAQPIPHADRIIFAAVLTLVAGVFLWRRYR